MWPAMLLGLLMWPFGILLLIYAAAVWLLARACRAQTLAACAFGWIISLDQLGNASLGGDPDMTLSGRMGRAIKDGRCKLCRVVCFFLNKIDPNHCARVDRQEADEGSDEVIRL